MNHLEILYPRSPAKIEIVEDQLQPIIEKEIREIERGKVFKRHKLLSLELKRVIESKPVFVCAKCNLKEKTINLILHDFVSISDTMDETRYDDYNVICPFCGHFNYINDKGLINYFKDVQETYKSK